MCLQISNKFNQLEQSALGRVGSVEMKMERIFTQKVHGRASAQRKGYVYRVLPPNTADIELLAL